MLKFYVIIHIAQFVTIPCHFIGTMDVTKNNFQWNFSYSYNQQQQNILIQ